LKSLPETPGEPLTPAGLAAFLTDQTGISPETPLRVAFSGGLDSHVLLHCLAGARAIVPWPLAAVHVHHGLSALAEEWVAHCQGVCDALRVPLEVLRVAVQPRPRHSLQALAREARYRALAGVLPAGGVLLTGHHLQDQAETIVLMALRAGGLRGLAGMPLVAPFPPGRLARPLLNVDRGVLSRYAVAAGLRWIDDPANADHRHARSRLRQEVWPALTGAFPDAARQLARTARHAGEAQGLLDGLAGEDLAHCGRESRGLLRGPVVELSVTACQALPAARLGNLLRFWLHQAGERVPGAPAQAELVRQMIQGGGAGARLRIGEHSVRRYRDRLVLVPDVPAPAPVRIAWTPPGPVELPGLAGWRIEGAAVRGSGVRLAALDGHRVELGLRSAPAHAHRLKHLYQAAGVPPWERAHQPLLFVDGELAALAGAPPAAAYRAGRDEEGMELRMRRTI